MAWTTPRTWVAGEEVTATLLNTHLRDNLRFMHGSTLPRVRVETAAQETGVTVPTCRSVVWQRAAYDPVGVWGGGAEVTVPTGGDGVWRVGGAVQMSPSAAYGHSIEVELDGIGGAGTRLSGAAAQSQTWWTEHRCVPHVEAAVTAGQTFALTLRGAYGDQTWLGWFQWGYLAPEWRWDMTAAMWARLVAI